MSVCQREHCDRDFARLESEVDRLQEQLSSLGRNFDLQEAEVERLKVGTAALSAGVRVAEAVANREQERADYAEAEVERLRAALGRLVSVIDAAGVVNLARGVQLGAMSWLVKAEDALQDARAALRGEEEKLFRRWDGLLRRLAHPGEEEK